MSNFFISVSWAAAQQHPPPLLGCAPVTQTALRSDWKPEKSWVESRHSQEVSICSKAFILDFILTQFPIQWVLWALYQRIKWPELKADHSPPSEVKVKNEWIHRPTTKTYDFHGMPSGSLDFIRLSTDDQNATLLPLQCDPRSDFSKHETKIQKMGQIHFNVVCAVLRTAMCVCVMWL